jgi:putative nucleotidyltransferase with HDIG domain
MVGNLAERAAEAIGADPLMARVESYYHDVGKLANPLAFIENQAGGENSTICLDPHVGPDPPCARRRWHRDVPREAPPRRSSRTSRSTTARRR